MKSNLKTKTCSKCCIERPLSDFYYRNDNKNYRNTCVYCLDRRKRKSLFIDLKKKLHECSKCGQIKSFEDFHKCNTKLKIVTVCKVCRLKQINNYRRFNREKYRRYYKELDKKIRKERPWDLYYDSAKQRCENKNSPSWPNYGGRGIKLLMTKEDFKTLWFRDKAFEMIKPSVHRINNDGNYEINNCIFMEMRLHSGLNSNSFLIKQFDLDGNLVKTWNSYLQLSKSFSKAIKNSQEFLNYKWITKRRG